MEKKYIISGGGTGGHIFPALSIANEIMKRDHDAKILFVGALGRMEMEKVPAAGYPIIGLPVEGIQRKLGFRNIVVLYKLLVSLVEGRTYPEVIQTRGCYRSWRICQRAPFKNGRHKKDPHPDTGTEFLCRGNKPVTGPQSGPYLRCLCGNGQIFPG